MDQQRGRSPSGGHHQNLISRHHSPSPQFQGNNGSIGLGLGLDPTLSTLPTNVDQNFLNSNFNSSTTLPAYDSNDFLAQQNLQFTQAGLGDPGYATTQDFSNQFKQEEPLSEFAPPARSYTQELLSANNISSFTDGDFSLFQPPGQTDQFEQPFFGTQTQQSDSSLNLQELNMNSPPNHAATPPNMLRRDSRSPSAHQSPNFTQGQFQPSPSHSRPSPGHSRNASLGPESAAFPQAIGQGEWGMMGGMGGMGAPQFTTHRRSPSEYSDISVHSNSHSPHMGHHDSFETIDSHHSPSPMQHAQDSLYQEVLGIGNFSLNDPQQVPTPHRGLSPAHSPAISPRLVPQQMPNPNNSFMLGLSNGFNQQHNSMQNNMQNNMQNTMMYGSQQEFPQMQQHGNGSVDMGQAPVMAPPEINVEFAPASRQNSFEPPKPSVDLDALTPPDRGRRRRAVSDTGYQGSSSGPGMQRQHSPGLVPNMNHQGLAPHSMDSHRSLSPNDRSGASSPSKRRQSTSSLPNRDYILGLADPEYQAQTPDNNAKRVQKHPATFQCTICPKRFTRAYNLRSHLRTHTDERPFVCTVCGKAFARQHDRKRHEGLHTGDKKFMCKGELKQGGQWGCGRKFARADALGRHFRSEAGRICIKPLLDEEAAERQRQWHEQRMQHNMQQPIPVDSNGFPIDASGSYNLPAALLAQYPALANLSWSDMPGGDVGLDDDPSGRSSFDASGSEYYDEGDEGGYVSSGPGPQQGYHPQQAQMTDGYNGYSSDIGAR